MIIVDPCDPPTFEPPSDLIDQFYTLTDTGREDYVTAAWTITPSFCEVDFTQSCTPLSNGETSV